MNPSRAHVRASLHSHATVIQGERLIDYELVNLSAGGALLYGAPLLSVGDELVLRIRSSETESFLVQGRVARHEAHGTDESGAPRTAFGIAFVVLDHELEARLARVVTERFQALGAKVLGLVRAELQRQGITDISVVAEELHKIKEEQSRAHLFASDLFTREGSNSSATIVSGTTGEQRDCIVWSLNLYLGLNRNPRVIRRACEALEQYGTGCGTSAPSGGLNALHHEIEVRVAAMVGKPKSIVFTTGYAANLGALSALPGPKDLVLLDRECHASMFDGVKLSGKKYMAFKHNDVADLDAMLRRYKPLHENIIVVVESAYSMSGDLSPLREIAALKKDHSFYLFVDEAHTFGFYGEGGRGYCHEQGVTDSVDFIMSTFSKATASSGGFVAAEAKFCTLLQATSTPYIFQACLPPPAAATILAALDEIEQHPEHAANLHANNRLMRDLLVEAGFNLGNSQSPVIPVYVPDLEKLYRICAALYREGIFSVPVVYPAVGVNEGRIRFIANAHHTPEQIRRTVDSLARHARELGVIAG